MDLSWEEINRADPSRFTFGEPFCLFSSPDSTDTNEYIPVFEMYPAPKFERIYEVIYLRNGRKFRDDGSDDEAELPSPFTEELVLNRARVKAYEFAIAKAQDLKLTNIGRFQNLIVLADRQKDDLLDAAKKITREDIVKALGGEMPGPKIHCSVLAADALKKAIENYKKSTS